MSDMTLSEAAAECGKWGQLIRALSKVQESAVAIQGLEQNITERTKLRDELAREIDAARNTLALELEAVEQARTNGRDLVQNASQQAHALISDAEAKAKRITKESQDAATSAAAERDVTLAAGQAASKELEALSVQIVEARAVLTKARTALAAIAAAGV